MKSVLIVCNQSKIDPPLRRSLAHLVKSCRVEIVSDGYLAFNELQDRAFDLIVIDSEITGIDSLELAESIEYIDPGVPVIFMLKQAHKALWGPARQAKANPIYRPFKPLAFLRLVDTLLHQQLEHYRGLSDSLQSILQTLRSQTNSPQAFLIEDSGQILVSTGKTENPIIRLLGSLAANRMVTKGLFLEQHEQEDMLLAKNPADKDHELYITPVLENLRLALISPVTIPPTPAEKMREQIKTAVQEIRRTFFKYSSIHETPSANGDSLKNSFAGAYDNLDQTQIVLPLKLGSHITPQKNEPEQDDDVAVNWQILSNSSSVLNRLHDFCQVN